MGKRLRGAALRSKKRGAVAAEEIVETTAVDAEESHVVGKEDEELFVVDTTAILPSKKQLVKKDDKLKKQQKYQSSAKEEAQIQKLVAAHPLEKLQEMADAAKAARTVASSGAPFKRAKRKGAVQPTYDLWGGDNLTSEKKQKTEDDPSKSLKAPVVRAGLKPSGHVKRSATLKALPAPAKSAKGVLSIDVAKPGQSYNPDANYHQTEIEEALRVESKREWAEMQSKAPVSKGLSDETRALLLGDTDSEDEDGDNDSDADDGSGIERRDDETSPSTPRIEKRPEKFTRAQRNKQKRVRNVEYEIQERKRQKKLQNAVAEAKAVAKKLKKEETAKTEQKEKLKQLKSEKERVKGKDVYQQLADENPIGAPTYPVALPNELKQGGSLRTIRPKGSLVTDRMVSLMDRDMAPKKQLKQKRRIQGKKRKVKVRGKGFEVTKEGEILG